MKEHLYQELESKRDRAHHLAALTLQRYARTFFLKKRFYSLRRKIILIQSRSRGYLARCGPWAWGSLGAFLCREGCGDPLAWASFAQVPWGTYWAVLWDGQEAAVVRGWVLSPEAGQAGSSPPAGGSHWDGLGPCSLAVLSPLPWERRPLGSAKRAEPFAQPSVTPPYTASACGSEPRSPCLEAKP